jgi:hypothetical protein
MSCRIVACHLVDILFLSALYIVYIAHAFHLPRWFLATRTAVERIESNGSSSLAKKSPVAQLDYFVFIIQEMEGDFGRNFPPCAHLPYCFKDIFVENDVSFKRKQECKETMLISFHFMFKETCPEYGNIPRTSNVHFCYVLSIEFYF